MTLADPFTSDNARVVIVTGAQAARLIASVVDFHKPALVAVYGPLAALEYKHYFGQEGQWRAGYRSEFGFHIRGRADDPAAAVYAAIAGRESSDPSPPRNPQKSSTTN